MHSVFKYIKLFTPFSATRSTRKGQSELSSPPSTRRRVEASSPNGDVQPFDSSPLGQIRAPADESLLTSPRGSKLLKFVSAIPILSMS